MYTNLRTKELETKFRKVIRLQSFQKPQLNRKSQQNKKRWKYYSLYGCIHKMSENTKDKRINHARFWEWGRTGEWTGGKRTQCEWRLEIWKRHPNLISMIWWMMFMLYIKKFRHNPFLQHTQHTHIYLSLFCSMLLSRACWSCWKPFTSNNATKWIKMVP